MPFRLVCSAFASLAEELTVPNVIDSTFQPEPGLWPALDIPETAKLFNCHPRTVWRMIRDGRLPARKVGSHWRIRRDVALDYLSGDAA
jgi:excisionase family DNA binding protein